MSEIRRTTQGWPMVVVDLTDEQVADLAGLRGILDQANAERRPMAAIAQVFPDVREIRVIAVPNEIAAKIQALTAPNHKGDQTVERR